MKRSRFIGALLLLVSCNFMIQAGKTKESFANQSFIIGTNTDNLIVCPKQPAGYTAAQTASRELKDVIEKITGKRIQKITSVSGKRIKRGGLIFVGESPVTKSLGFDLSAPVFKSGKSAYRIAVKGGNLFLMGADEARSVYYPYGRQGTLYAAYAFLEKFGGACWFWPGATGEFIPKKKNIRVPVMDIVSTPFFPVRNMRGMPRKGKEAELFWQWSNRNRFVSDWQIGIGHSFKRYVNGNKMFSKHPEWYSMYQGSSTEPVRQPFTHNGHVGQLCTTNVHLLDYMADRIAAHTKQGVNVIYSISPNDGYRFCVCPACRKLDIPGKAEYKQWGAQGNISNRMWAFANEIGRRLKKKGLKTQAGLYAYTFCRKPPERISKVEDNILVGFAVPFQGETTARRKQVRKLLEKWQKKTQNIFYRGYWYGFTPRNKNMINDIRLFKKLNLKGTQAEFTRNFALKAPTYYLLPRLLWDPDIDTDKELDSFYNLAFGKAAPYIRRYFDKLEQAGGKLVDSELYHLRAHHLLLPIFTPQLFKELEQELINAKSVADRKDVAARIEWLIGGWKFLKIHLDYLHGLTNLKASGFGFNRFDRFPAGKVISDLQKLRREIARVYKLSRKRQEMIKEHNLDFAFIGLNSYNYSQAQQGAWDKDLKSLYEDFVLTKEPRLPVPVIWKFRKDEKNNGESLGVHLNSYDDTKWHTIRTNDTWEKQGYPYDGVAWYRQRMFIPEKQGYPVVKLFIGASDESTWIYVNGQLCGKNIHGPDNPNSWQEPIEVDITKAVRFNAVNLLTVKVRDVGGAGGIYKPCVIRYAEKHSSAGNDLLNGIGGFEKKLKKWHLDTKERAEFMTDKTVFFKGQKSLNIKLRPGKQAPKIYCRFRVPANSRLQLSLTYKASEMSNDPKEKKRYNLAARINFSLKNKVKNKYRKWLVISEKNRGEDLGNGWRRAICLIKTPYVDSRARLSIFLGRTGTYHLDEVKIISLK